ncbi:4850_t:CDS:2, partial [Ambispora gerdemannii]
KSLDLQMDYKTDKDIVVSLWQNIFTELFTDKIEYYLTSLKNIPNQNEKRCTKAQELFDRYDRLSDFQDSKSIWWNEKNQIEIGTRPDRQLARDWQSRKSKETACSSTFNVHSSTINDNYIGTINGGIFGWEQ